MNAMTARRAPTHSIDLREFHTPQALALAQARAIAARLRTAIARRGHATLAVSGGNTPRRFLAELAQQALDWDAVTLVPVDERWVPTSDPRSNEGLLRTALHGRAAAAARVVSLYADTATPESALSTIEARVAALPWFDAVVLGMGVDGHTASFFADADRLPEALDPDAQANVAAMRAASAGEPRMTLSLARLLRADALYLHIEGAAKWRTFTDALVDTDGGAQAPIRAVLLQERVPLTVYWCP